MRSRKKRAVLAQRIFPAEKALVMAYGPPARGAPVEALRTLSAVRLPRVVGPTADAAFTTACRAAVSGLEADAAARETALAELVEQSATSSTGTSRRSSRPWRRTPRAGGC